MKYDMEAANEFFETQEAISNLRSSYRDVTPQTVAISIIRNGVEFKSIRIPVSEWSEINFADYIEFDRNTGDLMPEFYAGYSAGECAKMLTLCVIAELESRPMSSWTDEELARYNVLTGQEDSENSTPSEKSTVDTIPSGE